jgi:hypothetical protein
MNVHSGRLMGSDWRMRVYVLDGIFSSRAVGGGGVVKNLEIILKDLIFKTVFKKIGFP